MHGQFKNTIAEQYIVKPALNSIPILQITVYKGQSYFPINTLNIFYCSIINNRIEHKFHNLETSSPIPINE